MKEAEKKAKEKAKEIIEKFYCHGQKRLQGNELAKEDAKQCALIHVNGIISVLAELQEKFGVDQIEAIREITKSVKHYLEVKKEIENL